MNYRPDDILQALDKLDGSFIRSTVGRAKDCEAGRGDIESFSQRIERVERDESFSLFDESNRISAFRETGGLCKLHLRQASSQSDLPDGIPQCTFLNWHLQPGTISSLINQNRSSRLQFPAIQPKQCR